MSEYLQKRRKRWYAVLEIPRALRVKFGRPRFVRSLGTDSETVAARMALVLVAAWKKEIEKARGEVPEDDTARWRRVLQRARSDEERRNIIEQIEAAAIELGAVNVEHEGQDPTGDPEARKFYFSATGVHVGLLEHLNEWLAGVRVEDRTRDYYRMEVTRFAKTFPQVQDVKRPEVQRWVMRLLNQENMAPRSVRKALSAVRQYWAFLQTINVAAQDNEPFDKVKIGSMEGPNGDRLPFVPADVVSLWKKAQLDRDQDLADLIWMAQWTGARIEELCSLQVEHVKKDHFEIVDAKTKAGIRSVPIHPKLAPTLKRLIGDRKSGYVLANLTADKRGDRSNTIGRRFSTLKTDMGFGKQHVFHSIRKTMVTILEDALVPENVVADIVGHEKKSLTYGLYSGGTSLRTKAEALKKLKYPGV